MSIKSQGGVFGRNPTFNTVTVDGGLSIAGTLSVGGETITGLSYQGGWNADTNTPDIANSGPVTGQFWIVSADGSTNVGGITNWTSGDWALYDGTNWQRVEGGNTDLTTGVQGQLAVANGGTGAADASTARTNLGLGTAATTASTDYATAAQGTTADSALQPADIGSTVQGYDADTAKYDDTTANFTGTLQNGGSNVVVDSDIGSTVQGYDANTAKYDDATAAFTGNLSVDSTILYVDSTSNLVGIGTSSPADRLHVYNGSSGLASFAANTDVIIEDDGNAALQFATPNNKNQAIYFSDPESQTSGFIQYSHIDDSLEFRTAGSEAATFTSSGNLAFPSGQGIDFSATSGTGTSELLDDYEEGTFTPTIVGSTTAGTGTYTKQVGEYTKIGNTVFFRLTVAWSAHTGTGKNRIAGLPYTPASAQNVPCSFRFSNFYYGGANYTPTVTIIGGQTQLRCYAQQDNSGVIELDIDTSADIYVSGHYQI